ncbi:MAG: hypothetical protein IPN83_25180 [Holophagales bacterium]|nr:hypothetical protein [Holophagales bacterium]
MAEVIGTMTFPAGGWGLLGRIAAAAGLLAALGVGPSASANLRAPVVIPESPSSALSAPTGLLIVTGESLTFVCGGDACVVTARYDVSAETASRVQLEFILPAEVPVTATTNGDRGSAEVVPAAPLDPEEARNLPQDGQLAPRLYRAGFQSDLREGSNTVTVRYSQPLGAEEVDYGYLKKEGRMVQRFRYELWPLREWKRSPGFRVKLAVAIERPAPGWWKRRFGNQRSVACVTSGASVPPPVGRFEQRGGQLWYEAELGPSIPDRITCFVGDDDLMPRN